MFKLKNKILTDKTIDIKCFNGYGRFKTLHLNINGDSVKDSKLICVLPRVLEVYMRGLRDGKFDLFPTTPAPSLLNL